jgi:hypothetical protein
MSWTETQFIDRRNNCQVVDVEGCIVTFTVSRARYLVQNRWIYLLLV